MLVITRKPNESLLIGPMRLTVLSVLDHCATAMLEQDGHQRPVKLRRRWWCELGPGVRVCATRARRGLVRVGIEAPREVKVARVEVARA